MNNTVRKYILWAVLALPAVIMIAAFASGGMDHGGVIHQTGLWSATFLLPALAATPFRRVFPNAMWPENYH